MSGPKWLGTLEAGPGALRLLFALCVQKQKHLSSLLFIPTMVGFGPLSTSWGRRNGWLGSSHWLNIRPLKGMVQGWAGISQD